MIERKTYWKNLKNRKKQKQKDAKLNLPTLPTNPTALSVAFWFKVTNYHTLKQDSRFFKNIFFLKNFFVLKIVFFLECCVTKIVVSIIIFQCLFDLTFTTDHITRHSAHACALALAILANNTRATPSCRRSPGCILPSCWTPKERRARNIRFIGTVTRIQMTMFTKIAMARCQRLYSINSLACRWARVSQYRMIHVVSLDVSCWFFKSLIKKKKNLHSFFFLKKHRYWQCGHLWSRIDYTRHTIIVLWSEWRQPCSPVDAAAWAVVRNMARIYLVEANVDVRQRWIKWSR